MPKDIILKPEEYKAILQRINELEKRVTTPSLKPQRATDRLAMVAIVDSQPVISWDQIKDNNDIWGRDLKISLHLLNGETVEKGYLWFMTKVPVSNVKILKTETKSEVVIANHGVKIDPQTDRKTNEELDYEVESKVNIYDVEVVDGELQGQKFQINGSYLNPRR